MRKPEFEQFRAHLLKSGKPIPEHRREPYRLAVVSLLEDSSDVLVQKARKDGHPDAQIEIHGSWVEAGFTTEDGVAMLAQMFPGAVFSGGREMHWVEADDEVIILEFAWDAEDGEFLTGRVKIVV